MRSEAGNALGRDSGTHRCPAAPPRTSSPVPLRVPEGLRQGVRNLQLRGLTSKWAAGFRPGICVEFESCLAPQAGRIWALGGAGVNDVKT